MHDNVVKFYQKVREDEDMFNQLSKTTTGPEIVELAVELAAKHNMVLSMEEAQETLGKLDQIILAAANDDELTDWELELVAAGNPTVCTTNTIDT